MATEMQKPNEPNLYHEKLSTETLEPPPSQNPSHTSRLDESPNPSTQPSQQSSSSIEDQLRGEPEKELKQSETPNTEVPSSVQNPDLEKKMRRAERFGMPVQMSEEEKRSSRAERFGTTATLQGSEEKKLEEQKRKARAERFGLPAQSTADEEAKKKARLARFTPVSESDPVEEEKKKARAIRFSQIASDAPSHVNGKANSEQKAGIVGNKATGES